MVTMTVRIEGVPETTAMLDRLRRIVERMRPTMTSVGEYLLNVFSNQAFESEGAIYGLKWQPLNPKYALWKSTRYPGRGILERSGNLRRGFKAYPAESYLLIENKVPYAAKHQYGRGVPQRTIVAIQSRQKSEIERIIQNDIMERFRQAL